MLFRSMEGIEMLPNQKTTIEAKPKNERIDMVLDTDTYNEVDDQFALAYALRSDDRLNVKSVYAAPFYNARASSPADGMEKATMRY